MKSFTYRYKNVADSAVDTTKKGFNILRTSGLQSISALVFLPLRELRLAQLP